MAILRDLQAQEYLVPVSSCVRFDNAATYAVTSKYVHKPSVSMQLPFFDDFSNYEGRPSAVLWQTFDAYVNKDFGPQPPTIGVATLDALDARGQLHAFASTTPFGGDTLASRSIRLDSVFTPQPRALLSSDSVYLTFYWLPGGGFGDMWARIGDAPETGDSLILEFYDPQRQWRRVWAVGGIEVDSLIVRTGTAWQWAAVPVNRREWLTSRFQFRFRNLCSLDPSSKTGMVGNCDQWNIDYIRLDYGRSRSDSLTRDVAFVSKAPSMLNRYYAMPATQYSASEMAAQLALNITNRYSQTLSTHYRYRVLDDRGSQVAQYDGGSDNLAPYCQGHGYQTVAAHATPPVNFSYTVSRVPQTFTVEHIVSEGIAGDDYPQNDTIRFQQVFDNYFAYDDGVPENGYGLTSTSSRIDMAVRFVLTRRDTLTALDLFFNRTHDDENVGMAFNLAVWGNVAGHPGTVPLYKDSHSSRVQGDKQEAFCRYPLAQPLVLEADTYYIGFEQASKNYINIGFDRSRNICGQNYYRTASEWQQSILNGAILLRPCFGTRALVDVHVSPPASTIVATLYPNPARQVLNVRLQGERETAGIVVELLDMQGRVLKRQPYAEAIPVAALPAGLYMLRLMDTQAGSSSVHKFLIAR